MKPLFLALTLTFLYVDSFCQGKRNEISEIHSIKDAEKYINANPKSGAKIFHVVFGSQLNDLFSQLLSKKPGYTFKVDNFTYKLLEFDSVLCNRVSYIYLDGSKMSKLEIDSIRQEIISKYKSGIDFVDLVKQFNMDGNQNGDTGWFGDNSMVPEFESAVKAHKIGEIFTVDTPSANWYHVALKTYNPTYQINFSILKVKSSS